MAREPEKAEPVLSVVEGGVVAAGVYLELLSEGFEPIIPKFVKINTT